MSEVNIKEIDVTAITITAIAAATTIAIVGTFATICKNW